jgi:hypothetical protein
MIAIKDCDDTLAWNTLHIDREDPRNKIDNVMQLFQFLERQDTIDFYDIVIENGL